MKRIKVRFNLQRGEHYMQWRVIMSDGSVMYYKPTECQLIMNKCSLKNNRKVAEKIYRGDMNKDVCAWVLCDSIEIRHDNFIDDSPYKVKYNPRVAPYWMLLGDDVDNRNVDVLWTIDYKICMDLKAAGYRS